MFLHMAAAAIDSLLPGVLSLRLSSSRVLRLLLLLSLLLCHVFITIYNLQ
jgi:hypothetical protein